MAVEKKLRKHQYYCVDKLLNNEKYGLLLGMGVGKTVITLTAIQTLKYNYLRVNRALVVAPASVAKNTWKAEVDEWEHLRGLRVERVIGSQKQRICALKKTADVYVISVDNFVWLCNHYGREKLPFDMLVLDESTKFKSHSSKRWKALKAVLPSIPRRVILTGTITPNSIEEAWTQIYVLDEGERLFPNISQFRRHYLYQPGRSAYSKYVPLPGKAQIIHGLIGEVTCSMRTEDYAELPAVSHIDIEVALPPRVARQYKKFKREKVLELLDGLDDPSQGVSAVNAAAMTTKLLQFADGAIYDAEKNTHLIHKAKLEALADLIEAADGPVLVGYWFKFSGEMIAQHLARYNPRIFSSSDDTVVSDWNAGKIKVLLLHPASGAHGLNLQYGGHTAVWYSQVWSGEMWMQWNARLLRPGQTKPVLIYYLLAAGTVDRRVRASHESKKKGLDAVMQAVKAFISEFQTLNKI